MNILEIEMNAILKASKDNIVIADGKGIILRASPNCLSIYGKDTSYLIGKSVYELEAANIFSPSVTIKVLKERKEVQVMQRTSTGRTVMATGFPVYNLSGEIIRVISFSHDLTEIQDLKEDYEELRTKMERYQSELEELRTKNPDLEDMVIQSKSMQKVWQLVQRVAKADASVVFLGESGVGKNVFAHALHNGSQRNKESLIEVNCGAIPESLFESEMFGYEPGSFTGANKQGKHGLIELADKGTLFLDEIGELPLPVQVKLLKAIQEKKVNRVGGGTSKNIDFRLIASTNQDLAEMVRQGKFREDLFYRLNVIPITIPPLRERKEDILMLAHFYLQKFNEKYEMRKFFHPSTIEELAAYDWPGNVRELQYMIERIVLTIETRTIYPDSLPFYLQNEYKQSNENRYIEELEERGTTLAEAIGEVEIRWLKRAVRQCKNTYEMGEYLGLNQSTVVRKLKKYGINAKSHLDALRH